MHPSPFHYLPLAPLFYAGLALLFLAAVVPIELGLVARSAEGSTRGRPLPMDDCVNEKRRRKCLSNHHLRRRCGSRRRGRECP